MTKKRKIPESDLPQGKSFKRRRLPVNRNAILRRIAKEIRSLYIGRRRAYEQATTGRESQYLPGEHWDGGVNRQGHNRSSIWLKIAVFCVEHGLDHLDYVQQVFIDPPCRRAPQPNQLLSQRILGSYRWDKCGDNEAARLEYIRNAFEEEKLRLDERLFEWVDIVESITEQKFNKREVQRAILGDDNLGLTPLFRFCLAIQQQQDDIAEYYYGAAILQYLRFPDEYQVIWGDLLPAWFHKPACSLRRKLLTAE